MLDSRTNDWLSRLQGHGPQWVSIALAALITVELVRIAIALVSHPVKSPQPVAPVAAPIRRALGVNSQMIVSAHLFGIATADPATQDPANAPPSSANLVLAGTIATQDPKHGIAIISDGGAPSKVFSVGDLVNGATLHSVYLDHVILDRGGTLETLQLPRLQGGPGTGRGPPMRRTVGDPRTVAAVDNIRRMVQQDPSLIDQVMRTVASYDSNAGKLRGFRAYPGRNPAIFNKLGLKAGDLVTAINGQPLDDPQRSQEVFNTIQTSANVTVTIERSGQKQDITLNIAQVAQDATKDLEGGDSSAPGAAAAANPTGAATPVPPPPMSGGIPTPRNENPNQ